MRRNPRQRPVSCHFCRVRKLRCSRQFPCSNCTSRGVQCRAPQDPPPPTTQRSAAVKKPSAGPAAASGVTSVELLRRLERLETLLAVRSAEPETSRPPPIEPEPSEVSEKGPLPSKVQNLLSDALFLERYSLSSKAGDSVLSDSIVFRTCPIRLITQTTSYLFQNSSLPPASLSLEPTRCIWLPEREDTRNLVDKYISDISYIHHIIHGPSVRRLVDNIYDKIQQDAQMPIGQVAFVLAICAHVTFVWTDRDRTRNLFPNASEAHSQAILWLKAGFDVLDHIQRISHISIEATQAMMILGFVACNLEGISIRVRGLMSRSITMARELGLHRLDATHNPLSADTVRLTALETEVGRRIWWYLCGTDWMLARFSGTFEGIYTINPTQMAVRKPQNIDDEDMAEGEEFVGKPLDQPTCMSYFLQRVRLAEMSRGFLENSRFDALSPGAITFDRIQHMEYRMKLFWDDTPAFFSTNFDLSTIGKRRANDVAIQRYVLNLFVHGQRCRIHLPYLARGAVEPAHAKSREACLESARFIIQTENKLEKENVGFASTWLRMTVALHNVFLASIALLLDVCLDPEGEGKTSKSLEVAIAWRILQDAKDQSRPAAKLLELLSQVMKKHNVMLPVNEEMDQSSTTPGAPQEALPLTPSSTSRNMSSVVTPTEPTSMSQGWQAIDSRMELDSIDWETLLWGLDAPFI